MDLQKLIIKQMDGSESLLDGEHCSKISMMESPMTEDVYILILQHFVENHKGYKQALIDGKETAYGATIVKDGKGLKFKVSQLPDDLQRIIVRYLKVVSI